jgi:tyrosyl-tRNA synthetase
LELISKKSSWTAYGITNKLILDSNGKKFGKSEGNAIWLDSKKNSPYICYNYFMNATDEDIERYLKLFCFLDLQEIWAIITEHQKDPSKRYGQQQLAYLATQIVFWTQAAEYANSIRIALFWWENPCEGIEKFEQDQVAALAGAIGSLQFKDSLSLIDVLVDTGLCTSRWDAKKDIQANAICVNETKITDINYTLSEKDFLQNGVSLIRKGKKTYKIVTKA